MGLLKRLRGERDEEPAEVPCPRCGVLVAVNTFTCAECGWDPREKYEDATGLSRTPGTPGAA